MVNFPGGYRHYVSLVLVGLFALSSSPLPAADGFLAWDKTQMWSEWSLIRAVHWADGQGWWAVGIGDVAPGEVVDSRGLVLRSATGPSGWSSNLLEWEVPDPWDPEAPWHKEHGNPQLGVTHVGNTLVTVGTDGAFAWNMADNSFTEGSEGMSPWDPDVPNTMFMWGGGLAYGSGRFVATDTLGLGGGSPTIHTTIDGVNWADSGYVSPATPGNHWDDWGEEWGGVPGFPLCFASGQFVAVTSYGWIIRSTDGLNWATVRSPKAHQRVLRGVAEKNGVFVAVGDGGTILRSTDGTTWRQCEVPVVGDLFAVAAGQYWFMAVGRDELVMISTDGATWLPIEVDSQSASTVNYTAVGYGDGAFLIATSDGHSLLSGAEPLPVGVAVSPPGAGVAVGPDKSVLAMEQGETLELTATAMPGFEFTGWTGGIEQAAAELTTTVNAPLSLTANFARISPLRFEFREGPPLQEPRMGHRAVDLGGRPVLLAGHTTGFVRSSTMEEGQTHVITGELTEFDLLDLPTTADGSAVAKLADGTYLVAGGASDNLGIAPGLDTAMIVGPGGGRGVAVSEVAARMTQPRMNCAAARMTGGQVLIVGGWYHIDSATYGDVFTPDGGGSFAATGALNVPRSSPLVLPTSDGGAVVAGGTRSGMGGALTVEYYNPATNTFTVLSDTLFDDGEPWILNTNLPGDVGTQQLPGGSYVLWAYHQTTHEGVFARFDPAARSFQRVPLSPSLTGVGHQAFMPVLDSSGTQAVVITASYDELLTESLFHVHVASLSTMQRVTTTTPFTVSGYFPIGASLTAYEVDGSLRLLLAGGSSTADYFQNFHPVARTFLFDPMTSLTLGDPTVVSTDYHGFAERADNSRMARAADGALHITYTRALNAPDDHDYFSFTRSRNAAGDWQPEVRAENFPDSNTANSILVDSNGLLHHGFTFNVGGFHTTSADGGATWSSPVPIRDGGWGFWDWNTQLAQANGSVFAVFHSCYGWQDFPANLMLREWQAGTGWGGPVWLTTLPNEDAMGTGAGSPRFQTRPDGNGVVVYTENLAAVPARTKLLDVSLPHGVTVSHDVSASGRWAQGGDVAVDSDGVAHVVWQEADAVEGPYELWYRTWDPVVGLGAPLRVTTPAEASVRTATVGAYPGGRVLVAYGLKGGASGFGGVFLRKIAGTPSAAQLVGRTANAHSPCLRSTWDMAEPNIVDLAWVEVYTWGSQLLHQEFAWAQLEAPETAAVTITSNWANATFTLSGPISGTFSLADGVWNLPNLPAGVYTITWHPVPGQAAPPPRTFVVSGDGEVTVGDSYIDENLHRVVFSSYPARAGTVESTPAGTELLGGQRAYADGEVSFRPMPVEGQTFVGWVLINNLGTTRPTANPLVVNLDRDYEVRAEFEPGGPFRVDTALFGEGTITPGTLVAAGGRFECVITPAAGQQVQEILLDGVSQTLGQNVVVAPVTGPHSIQAITGPITAEVIASWMPKEGGQVVVPENLVLNQNATITAQPAAGFHFVEWRGDASGTQASISLLVDGAKSVTAVFAVDGARGDLNDDGAISIEDAVLARRMFANEIPVNLARADMDASGTLAPADMAAILQAEARRDRSLLGAQPVATSGDKRQVTFPNGIALTLPGGWPTAPTQATVALLDPGLLPPLPPPLKALTPVYDIRLAGLDSFGREIGIEFPLPGAAGARNRDTEAACVLYLDPESNNWVPLPVKIGSKALAAGQRAGKYIVAAMGGNLSRVQGTNCVVYYDPAVAHNLGGATTPLAFASTVADRFDFVYQAYLGAGYNVPNYTQNNVDLFLTSVNLDHRADIYLSDTENTYAEAFYSWRTKNFYLPTSFTDADEVRFTLAHELFHAIQNLLFTGPGMAANLWLFEMTAEYASCKAPYNEPLSSAYLVDLNAALGSTDSIHEYACAHLLHYLLGRTGGSFADLWDDTLSTSFTPHAALNTYAKNQTSLSLNRLYAHFLEDVLFDSAVADLAMPISPTDWGGGNVIDKNLAIPAAEAAGWMKTRMPTFGSSPARVLIELPDGVPDRVNARVYQAPYVDPKTAGGREPLDSFFTGETLPFVSASLASTDSVYVLGYNYWGGAKNMRVWIRPLVLTMTQTPPAAVANTPCTFEAMVAPIPDCVQQLKAYWKPSDGGAWQIDTLSAQTQEFTYIHTFQTEEDKTFQVTFELYGLDADGRRQLIVTQTRNVAVDGRPSVQLVPSVARAEINQSVDFAAQFSNGPDDPVFRWTFGDGSPTVETTDPEASHVYTVAKTYTVTVGLADAAAPTVVLVQCAGQAVIEDPTHVVEPPPSPPPQAPGLDYSTLRKVDETRWWDGVREVYYLDASGRRHGLYLTFLQSGSTSKPLEAGMYIHGRREGQWLAYQQDGTGAIDRWEYQWDLAYGLNGQARQFSTLARFGGGGSPVNVYFDEAGVTHMNWPMAEIKGQACVLHFLDGSYETVSFDAQGRRHGACTVHSSAGRLLGQGSFTAGVKTGVWSYYEWSGGVATGVTYNHDRDPPNHK